jgi:hypothetical protein
MFDESILLVENDESLSVRKRGPVAQLGARFHGMEEVVGSIPTRSTNPFKYLETRSFLAWCHLVSILHDSFRHRSSL